MSRPQSANPQAAVAKRFLDAASIGLTGWRRWGLGIIIIIALWQYGNLALNVAIGVASIGICVAAGEVGATWLSCSGIAWGMPILPISFNAPFIMGMLGVWLAVTKIHKKTFTQAITGRASFDYRRALFAALVGVCVSVPAALAHRIVGVEIASPTPGYMWVYIAFALGAIVRIPVQAIFEETFYRGYMMQGAALLTRDKTLLALTSAALFTLSHLAAPDPRVHDFALYILQLMSFGAFLAILTLLDGGIELAVGYNAANSLFVALAANPASAIASPALFASHTSQIALAITLVDIAALALALLILNMRYKWFAYPWDGQAGEG